MPEELHQIIYISTANEELTEERLLALLSKSQKANKARGITGLLLVSDSNIIQIIEGSKMAVLELYDKIKHDSRHRGVILMSSRKIDQPDFPKFQMGFKRMNPETDAYPPGLEYNHREWIPKCRDLGGQIKISIYPT
jgi:hypothetical protein